MADASKDDTIFGTSDSDNISGGAGNDTLSGGDGNDKVIGGSGDDTLSGDEGDDRLVGGAGNDTLDGGVGVDTLTGGSGNDLFIFETGFGTGVITDFKAGEGSDDVILLRNTGIAAFAELLVHASEVDGSTVLTFDNGDTLILEGVLLSDLHEDDFTFETLPALFTGGNDFIDFNTIVAATYLDGTQYAALEGDDFVILPFDQAAADAAGYDLSRTFDAGDGNDLVAGGSEDDHILGGAGDDTILPLGGDDVIDGGDGFDTVFYDVGFETGGITYTAGTDDNGIAIGDGLVVGDASIGTDMITGVEQIAGTAFDDAFYGGDLDDFFSGNGGSDVMYGGAGNDFLVGDGGDDHLEGGDGDDNINGGLGNDTLLGGAGNDAFFAMEGDDVIDGGDGIFDSLQYNFFPATGGITYVGGTDMNGIAIGTAIITGDASIGTDTATNIEIVNGTNLDDVFSGGSATEFIFGMDGNDVLSSGGGNDAFWGGAGADLFIFKTGDGGGFIDDFSGVVGGEGDTIDLTGVAGLNDFTDLQAAMFQSGATVLINLGGGEFLTLNNTLTSDLQAGDFIV